MARLRIRGPAVSSGAGALLAVSITVCAPAFAQNAPATTPVFSSPLAAPAESEKKLLPYERFSKVPPRPPRAPARFEKPAASAAGKTGFDSSNSKKTAKRAPAAPASATSDPATPEFPLSFPVKPATATKPANDPKAAYAQSAPGSPPVEFGPINPQPRKRRPREDADPYAPLGLRSGGLLYFPAVELIGGYDTNPGRSAGGKGAAVYTAAPELRVLSDWPVHEFKADLRGSYTGYSPDQTPALSRPYFSGKADGRVDLTRSAELDLGARSLVSTDNPGSPNLDVGLARLPLFVTYGGYVGTAYRFNRLQIGVRADAERTTFENSKLVDGSSASNADRAYNQFTLLLRGSYELTPGVTPFVEGGTDARRHDLATDFSGYRRNSNGWIARVGSTIELSRTLTGEIAVGYVNRDYADARLPSLQGLIGNASLIWTASSLTTVKFTATSTVGEATIPGVSGVLYRYAELQVDHAFRRWLIGTLKGGYGQDDYVGSGRLDDRYYVGAGITYKINRTLQLKGEVRRDWLHSNVAGNDYAANIYLLGLRLQY